MKKQILKDERILAQKRKIGSDAFQIIFFGLLASILIQQHLFKAPFSQYAVEAILLIIASLYVVVRNFMEGNDIYDSAKGGQKLLVINSLVCGLTIAVVNGVLNYAPLGDMTNVVFFMVITFLCGTVSSFIVLQLLYLANKKKQKNLEARLTDDDDNA